MTTVQPSAKLLTRTIVETALKLYQAARRTRPVPTSPTVPPKSAHGPVTTGMLSQAMNVSLKRKALVKITDILQRSLRERSVKPDWCPSCQSSAIRTIASNAS